jgi:hypothetical protein
MAMSLGIGIGLPFGGAPASAAVAGTSPTVFATTPAIHYHPNSQSGGAGYTKSGDNVTACPSLGSLAAAMSGIQGTSAAVVGPLEQTDALGRKFWRFNAAQAAMIGPTLSGIANRAITTLIVGRVHHQNINAELIRPRWAAYTNDTTNTQANSSIGFMRGVVTSSSGQFLQGQAPIPTTADPTNAWKTHLGAQMQVMCVASRTTANGGQRVYINGNYVDCGQMTTSVTGYVGAIIGGTNTSTANQADVSPSSNAYFDIYEVVIWTGEHLNAATDAMVSAAQTNYDLTTVAQQAVLVGDSITFGVATSLSVSPLGCEGVGSVLSAPGAGYIPADCRLINIGVSGATTATIITNRDATNSVYSAAGLIPGGTSKNLVICHMGTNDIGTAGPASTGVPATVYGQVVAYWNTTTTGVLQRGWRGVQVGNTARNDATVTGSPPDAPTTFQARIEGLRALMFTGTAMNNTFKTDTLTNTGQTYDGLLTVLPVHEITVSGDTAFKTTADAGDAAAGYYDTDFLHLRVAGGQLMASGGDNAAYGYGAAI